MENEEKRGNIEKENIKLIILNSLPIPATYEGKTKEIMDRFGPTEYAKAIQELLEKKLITVKEEEGKVNIVMTDEGKKFLEELGKRIMQNFITEDGIRGLFAGIVETKSEENFIDNILTYFRSLEVDIEERYADVFRIWNSLPIEDLNIIKVGDEETYEFKIFGKWLKVDGNKILTPNAFIWSFFKSFGVVLPPIPKKVWHYMLTKWKTTIAKFTKERYSDEDIIVDTILNYVNNCLVAKDIKMSLAEGYVYVEGKKVYVPNLIVKRILDREKIRIGFRRLAEILKDYKFVNERKRIDGQRYYFWVFNLDKLNLDLNKVVEPEEKQVVLK